MEKMIEVKGLRKSFKDKEVRLCRCRRPYASLPKTSR